MEGEGRRREGKRIGLGPFVDMSAGTGGSLCVRSEQAHGLPRITLPLLGTVQDMGMAKKIAAFGIAKKVYDEARKPHNQAKIKQAVQKVQERRGAKRY
jgi:hypothetical protein